jgi:hypothetical protein
MGADVILFTEMKILLIMNFLHWFYQVMLKFCNVQKYLLEFWQIFKNDNIFY